MSETQKKHADPSALGLFGLAMVTLVASSSKLEITDGVFLVMPWAIFLGAIAQIIAGIYDYKKLNIFGATAFIGYGLFWLGVSMTWCVTTGMFGEIPKNGADIHQLGFAYLGYLIFTLIMTVGAIETNKVLLVIFVLIDCLFIGLTFSTFGIMEEPMHKFAAYSELAIAFASFYGVASNLYLNHFGYELLPIGKPMGIFVKKDK